MRLENANLCLAFGWEHFIFTNCFCGRAFFFDYSDALFEWWGEVKAASISAHRLWIESAQCADGANAEFRMQNSK